MRKLLQLLNQNRAVAGRKFEVKASGDEATIYLYDAIVSDAEMAAWYGGVDPLSFAKALGEITAATIHLRINSPGGDVFAGQAIAQAIREHPATVIAHVDGVAASAASVVAVACDQVEIAAGGFFMIHNAWMIAIGNSADMAEAAGLLDKVDGTIAAQYADATKGELDQLRAWMSAETWFTAQESVDHGFADRIAPTGSSKASAAWNLAAYDKAPKTTQPPAEQTKPPAKSANAAKFEAAQRKLRVLEKTA